MGWGSIFRGTSRPAGGGIAFDANGRATRVDLRGGRWEQHRSGPNLYRTQRGRSLAQAAEILKALPPIPAQTYYLVETPDGTLGRDALGFFTEAPLRTSGLRLETGAPAPGAVESVGLAALGEDRQALAAVAHARSAGRHAALVLLMECGRCGYQSPVETAPGDFERQCYACGAMNRSGRGTITVLLGSRAVQV